MKNASDILNLLQNRPQFSKLSNFKCIETIRRTFSPPLQKMIKFAYVKNDTLFFVLNHPGAKQEFDNNIQSIKSALKFVKPKECIDVNFTDIKAFVSHTFTPPRTTLERTDKHEMSYKERANGNFTIQTHDPKLNEIFQSIQQIIKENNES